jgi:hypothetical protein
MSGVIPPLPNTPAWRDDQLKRRDFTFTSFLLVTSDPSVTVILIER